MRALMAYACEWLTRRACRRLDVAVAEDREREWIAEIAEMIDNGDLVTALRFALGCERAVGRIPGSAGWTARRRSRDQGAMCWNVDFTSENIATYFYADAIVLVNQGAERADAIRVQFNGVDLAGTSLPPGTGVKFRAPTSSRRRGAK